jgi:hypothetical protein
MTQALYAHMNKKMKKSKKQRKKRCEDCSGYPNGPNVITSIFIRETQKSQSVKAESRDLKMLYC